MQLDTERQVMRRLMEDPDWAKTRLGRLARTLLDYDISIRDAAQFVGVHPLVLRRWVYPCGGRSFGVGGSLQRRRYCHERIDRLMELAQLCRWPAAGHSSWSETLTHMDRIAPVRQEVRYDPTEY